MKIKFYYSLISIFILSAVINAATLMDGKKLFYQLDEYKDKTVYFYLACDYNKETDLPNSIKRKFKNDYIFVLNSYMSNRPVYLAVNKKNLKKYIPKPIPGQIVIVKGKVRQFSTGKSWRKAYVIDVRLMKSYFSIQPLSKINKSKKIKNKIDFAKYKDADLPDLLLRLAKFENKSVHVKLKIGKVQKLEYGNAVKMGIKAKDWILLTSQKEVGDPLDLYLHIEQEEDLKVLKTINDYTTLHIYGRAIRSLRYDDERSALVVDRILKHPYNYVATQNPDNSATKNTSHQTKENSATKQTVRQNLKPVFLKTRRLMQNLSKYNTKLIVTRHIYNGWLNCPKTLTKSIDDFREQEWNVLRNKGTDLEGLIMLFSKDNKKISKLLQQIEIGDTIMLKGILKIFTLPHKKRAYLVLQSAK